MIVKIKLLKQLSKQNGFITIYLATFCKFNFA